MTLDASRGVLLRDGRSLILQPRVRDALCFLLDHPGEVIAADALRRAVWPRATPTRAAVTQLIRKARRALGDPPNAPVLLLEEAGGYRFATPEADHAGDFAPTLSIPAWVDSAEEAPLPSPEATAHVTDLGHLRRLLRAGQRLLLANRFEVVEKVGVGGMGAVFKAWDRETGEPVAVKILHRSGEEDVARFRREGRVLAALKHPGVIRYVAHGTTDTGLCFLATEWLDGHTLDARLASEGALGVAATRALATHLCSALAHAHERGLIHRDLKPDNIYLVDGRLDAPKLLDFGLARFTLRDASVTSSGDVLGTLGYMAPEQARGDTDIDARADVFGLGCLIFECLTGRPPFVGPQASLILKVVLEEAPRLSSVRPELVGPLDELLAEMLAREREGRPVDARAVGRRVASLPALADPQPPATIAISGTYQPGQASFVSAVLAGMPGERVDETAPIAFAEWRERVEALREGVVRYQGNLELLGGSMIAVALDAVPGTPTQRATAAAECALWMRAALPGVPLVLTSGLYGSEGGRPMRQAIDRALRLMDGARPGALRIDEATADVLCDRFVVDGRGLGLELVGPRAPVPGPASGLRSTLVGREAAMQILEGVYRRAYTNAQRLIVVGDSGSGRSRLAWELAQRPLAAGEQVMVLYAGGEELSARTPLGLLSRAIRAWADLPSAATPEELQAVVTGRLLHRVPEAKRGADARAICAMLTGEDPGPSSGDVAGALTRWLDAEGSLRPILLLLDDLEWADAASLRLLRHVLDARPRLRIAVVGFTHPDSPAGEWLNADATIQLRGLEAETATALVNGIAGARGEPELVNQVVEAGAGLPRRLEEMAAAGRVAPESELARAALDRLPGPARRLVRAASLFGPTFWNDGLVAMLNPRAGSRNEGLVAEALPALVEARVVVGRPRSRLALDEEYTFRSRALWHAAQARLSVRDKRIGRRLAGEWLEVVGGPDPGLIESHFEAAERPAEGPRARLETLAKLAAPWVAEGRLPDTRPLTATTEALRAALETAGELAERGRSAEARAAVEDALERTGGDALLRAKLAMLRARLDPAAAGALAKAERAAKRLAGASEPQEASRAQADLAGVYCALGRLADAQLAARAALATAPDRLHRCVALTRLAQARLAGGDEALALVASAEATTLLELAGEALYERWLARLVYVKALLANGAVPAARDALVAARTLIERSASELPDAASQRMFRVGVPEVAELLALEA